MNKENLEKSYLYIKEIEKIINSDSHDTMDSSIGLYVKVAWAGNNIKKHLKRTASMYDH